MHWDPSVEPEPVRIGPLGWLLVLLRGSVLVVVTYGGLVLLLLIRLVERPLFGLNRPVTPWITQTVCRLALIIIGIRATVLGTPMREKGAVVANHASWFDIFTLNAFQRIYFVAKAEVAGWAGIGWLARATGTVFIARRSTEAKRQQDLFEARLKAGHKLLFFPEGTSTDGIRVLPFKSTLFAAFFADGLAEQLHIQPVSVVYTAPKGQDERFYGWWGAMDFAPHLLKLLAAPRQGQVEITFHAPVAVADFVSRKHLASYCEDKVRSAFPAKRG
ncbi:MAG: 1-acyl-sn-glycerol-3-phosphate acyltransferase [Paracoccaceae bacterium]|nr:1-acyl-sn-glycerol-3-phosphate acyltransferase [Paracoccaceae bacterium]MDE3121705.1 1-acyl-sn-glycerol-3-phosphate acyltransferase [Paracoccaceae bacterium]MDE3240338.1 1-acyl-sn-glycerol-3-phosphate acyltransferase [Paracoccaceae bacterium]